MTNRLTMSSNVVWPIFRAWAARNWLPFIRPADSVSCTPARFVSPKRSSRLAIHVGKASTTCWKLWARFNSPDLNFSYAPDASCTKDAVISVNGRITMTTMIITAARAARLRRCRMDLDKRR